MRKISGLAGAVRGDRVGSGSQRGKRPVQLGGFGRRAPGEVLVAGLDEQVIADVFDAASQVEAGRAFGDQGPVPWPLQPGGLAPRGVEGQLGGAEVADRPGPLGLDQPQQVREVARRVRGAFGQPPRHLVQLGQQTVALVTIGGAGLPGQGQPAQQPGPGGRVAAGGRRQQRHRRRRMPRQGGKIAEDGRGDRTRDMREEKRQRVAGVPVAEDRRTTRFSGAFAAQHTSQPLVAVEDLAGVFAAGLPQEGQPRLHLSGIHVQRWRAFQLVVDGLVVDVPGVDQVTTRDQSFPGPLRRVETIFDRLEPATEDSEHVASLRGLGLVAAGLAQGHDPPRRPVPGGVIAAHHHSGEGGVTGGADQGTGGAVLKPDPQRLQAQPAVRSDVPGVVGRRRDRAEQADRGEQRGLGNVRPDQLVGAVDVVQPPVQVAELAVQLGGKQVSGRHGDAELTQRVQPEAERFRKTVPLGQAAHLHPRRVRTVQRTRPTASRSCRIPRPPPPGAPG